MTAYMAGVYEHPTRKADDTSLPQLHAEVAKGALEDAGLTKNDVDTKVFTLEEGVTMMTNLVDCDFDAIRIGQPVTVVFRATDGSAPVPMFTPA